MKWLVFQVSKMCMEESHRKPCLILLFLVKIATKLTKCDRKFIPLPFELRFFKLALQCVLFYIFRHFSSFSVLE